MRRAVRALSSVLIVAGLLLVADAAVTLAWQEPLSALYAQIQQDKLSTQLNDLDRAALTQAELRELAALRDARLRIGFLARRLRARATTGQALGRIKIPRIGISFVVVEGTDDGSLRKGPGHYPSTALPGMPGTVAIAGHRTTYLAPFRHIDQLRAGDAISIEMPYARFVYAVQSSRIVDPSDIGVVRSVGYERLVLSACHPLYSASHRIIVFARLVEIVPRGPTLAVPGASARPIVVPSSVAPLSPLPPSARRAAPLKSAPPAPSDTNSVAPSSG